MTDKLQYAGQFDILTCELESAYGKINLRASVAEINFYEDIFQSTISGNIVIFSSKDLLAFPPEGLGITGHEKLYLRIKTPSTNDDLDINYTDDTEPLIITRVGNRLPIGQNSYGMTLHFVSKGMVMNQRLRVSESFTREISDTVKKILKDNLKTNIPVNVEKTLGIRKVVIPNLHPFDAIRMLQTEALSELNGRNLDNPGKILGSPHFLFFQNLRGYYFITLQELYKNENQQDYNVGIANIATDDGQPSRNIDYNYKKALAWNPAPQPELLKNYSAGTLGAELYEHDIFQKKVETQTLNYFDAFSKFASTVKVTDARLTYLPWDTDIISQGGPGDNVAKIHLHPTSTVPISNTSDESLNKNDVDAQYVNKVEVLDSGQEVVEAIFPNQIYESLLDRQSRMFKIGSPWYGGLLTVNGHCGISAGDMIGFTKIPHEANLNGRYIVRNTRHYFNVAEKRHEVTMGISSDIVNYQPN